VTQQSLNLARVKSRIAPIITSFCRSRVGERFYMRELVEYVAGVIGVAPDSPSRILRDLRAARVVEYTVLSRAKSLYFVAAVSE
jgi:hypothetical protein